MSCSMSPATVGGQLTVSGSGYAAGSNYLVNFSWPYGGSGETAVTADSTGAWSTTTWANWSGTYNVSVLNSKGGVLATCSETVS